MCTTASITLWPEAMKCVLHAVRDRMAVADRHVAGNLDVDIDPHAQAALADAAHVDAGDAIDVPGDLANVFDHVFRQRRIHDLAPGAAATAARR